MLEIGLSLGSKEGRADGRRVWYHAERDLAEYAHEVNMHSSSVLRELECDTTYTCMLEW
jgi:hypothetical protein